MDRKLISQYRYHIFLAIVLSIVISAIKVLRSPLDISYVLIGSLIGAFVLDLEYVIYAYVFEPNKDFSKTLVAFLKHGDLINAGKHINYNKDEITDKSLNSALFQVVIAFASIFVCAAGTGLFVKALVLSIFLSSMYKLMEYFFENKLNDWFWAFKTVPTKKGVVGYALVLLIIFVYCLNIV